MKGQFSYCRSILIAFIYLFSISFVEVAAQDRIDLHVGLIPDSLLEHADAVIRQHRQDLDILGPDKVVLTEEMIITILNADSPFDILHVFYDGSSSVKSIEGQLYDAQGQLLRKYNRKDITDHGTLSQMSIYDDNRYKELDFSLGNEYPYTIQYIYEKKYDDVLAYDGWKLPSIRTSLQKARFQVTTPADFKLFYQVQGLASSGPKKAENDGSYSYTWDIPSFKAIPDEVYMPYWKSWLPNINISSSAFAYGPYEGDGTSWSTLGTFYYQINKEHNDLSQEMKQEVARLTQSASTNMEKINALYSYLQQNMRYVSIQLGIGGYQAFTASYVEKNKFGDCKALTYFMKSMLEEIGIASYPALIQTGYNHHNLDSSFAYQAFNHVILYVPEEDLWLECTNNQFPAGYIGGSNADHPVLWLTPEGGKLARTPRYPKETNKGKGVYDLTISAEGNAEVAGELGFNGILHERWRYYASLLPENEWNEQLIEFLSDLPSSQFTNVEIAANPDQARATVLFTAATDKYAQKSGKRLFVPLNRISRVGNPFPRSDDRRTPIWKPYGSTWEEDFILNLPSGYRVESIPFTEEHISSPWGEIRCTLAEESAGVYRYTRTFQTQKTLASPADYEDIFTFFAKAAKLDASTMVLIEQ